MHFVEDLRRLAQGDEEVLLSPCCHEGSDVQVRFHPLEGVLVITCAQCGMGVVDLVVAKRSLFTRRAKGDGIETPTVVQKMDQKSRKNRKREK